VEVASRSAAKAVDIEESDIKDTIVCLSLKRSLVPSVDNVNKGLARVSKR